MAKSKIISITGVTSNEAKQQFENLKKMVLPEMLLDRLNSDTLKQDNKLKTALESFFSGIELLNLLGHRVKKLKVNKELFPDNEQSMLKEVDNELKIMAKTLTASYTSKEKQFSDALTSALLIGYHTGAHDMRVNLERHANKGFQKNVLDPQKGGKTKTEKITPLRDIIKEMASFLYENNSIGKFSKDNATAAIFQLLYQFNLTNKALECFSTFSNNEIKEQFVKRQIKHIQKSSSLRQPSVNKLVEVLKSEYKPTKIKKKLKII